MKLYKKALSLVLTLSVLSSVGFPALAAENSTLDNSVAQTLVLNASDYSSVVYPANVDGFLMRLYNLVMQRDYDLNGINYWKDKLQSGSMNASNVARFFFSCNEFYDLNYSNEEYVDVLYKVFFNRNADTNGKNYWLSQLKSGKSQRYVLEGFINSQEWADTCAKFGVVSGTSIKANVTIVPSAGVTAFVKSLYSDVLGRSPDPNGLSYWTNELAYMRKSAKDVAAGFFFSPEFITAYRTMSPEKVVSIFYNVFLGRNPDSAGKDFWVGQIRSGKSLNFIYNGFVGSAEFARKCTSMGVLVNMPSATPVYSQPERVTSSTPTATPAPTVDKTNKSYTISTNSGNKVITGYYDAEMAYEIFTLLNNYRTANGVAPLTWNTSMLVGTNVRAIEIVYKTDHVRPNGDAFYTVPNGNPMRGENIAAATSASAQSFFTSWKNSSGHNANMLNSTYKTVSISVFVAASSDPYASSKYMYYYAVQNFGR